MVGVIPTLKLNNGHTIPVLGLGTWKAEPTEVGQIVNDAIDIGYRHFDCAYLYGNEEDIGTALQNKLATGVVQRSELFITSKLWNTQHRPDLVLPALKASLQKLKLDYLDLYLIHFPTAYKEGNELFPVDSNGKYEYSDVDYTDTWKELEKAVEVGLTKSIGISNFNSVQVERILKICSIKPVINQVECHPYLPQKKLVEYCTTNGILITGYSPLGSSDRPWATPNDPNLLQDEQLIALGKKYNKTSAQIILRWLIQRGIVVVPKTVHKSRLIENMDIFNFNLTSEDVSFILNNFERSDGRFLHANWISDHKNFPFSIEF